jgi:hypothetical protein
LTFDRRRSLPCTVASTVNVPAGSSLATQTDPAPETDPVPEYMRLDAVLKHYPFSRSDLYRRSAAGELEILKLGSRSVIRRSELERLLRNLPRLHPAASDAA